MSETVHYEVRDRVATLTLDRPARYNAIDDEMAGALRPLSGPTRTPRFG